MSLFFGRRPESRAISYGDVWSRGGDVSSLSSSSINSALRLAPVFTRKLALMPFDLANPVWIEDDDIDLDFHIRSATLRRPGALAGAAVAHGLALRVADDPVAAALELAGIFVMAAGMLLASLVALTRAARSMAGSHLYEWYRQTLARAILLGLEFLVAADIINTVAVDPSFRSVGVLGLMAISDREPSQLLVGALVTVAGLILGVSLSGPWSSKP